MHVFLGRAARPSFSLPPYSIVQLVLCVASVAVKIHVARMSLLPCTEACLSSLPCSFLNTTSSGESIVNGTDTCDKENYCAGPKRMSQAR